MIGENLSTFNGLPVQDFKTSGDIADLGATVPRLRCDYDDDETLPELLSLLLAEPGVERVRGLVLGQWREGGEAVDVTPRETIELLVANKAKLPHLEALFVGDIISEENEMSWIQNADLSPVWAAFPKLVEFGVRGQNGLRLGKINHATLEKFRVVVRRRRLRPLDQHRRPARIVCRCVVSQTPDACIAQQQLRR
jgi:hypothetical protein